MRKDFLLSQLVAVGALLATNVQALPAPSTLNDRERRAVAPTPAPRRPIQTRAPVSDSAPRQTTTVVIDPGHGGFDYGWEGYGLRESDIAYDLAARIEGRLGATGVRAYLSRGRDQGPGRRGEGGGR